MPASRGKPKPASGLRRVCNYRDPSIAQWPTHGRDRACAGAAVPRSRGAYRLTTPALRPGSCGIPAPTMQPLPDPDPELLRRIPLSARTILTVGRGTEALTAAYRLRNPSARLLGIDLTPNVGTNSRESATSGVEADPLPFDVPGGIDCIIYDGILEQVGNPWGLLRRHAEALGQDGMMLIRVQNRERSIPPGTTA